MCKSGAGAPPHPPHDTFAICPKNVLRHPQMYTAQHGHAPPELYRARPAWHSQAPDAPRRLCPRARRGRKSPEVLVLLRRVGCGGRSVSLRSPPPSHAIGWRQLSVPGVGSAVPSCTILLPGPPLFARVNSPRKVAVAPLAPPSPMGPGLLSWGHGRGAGWVFKPGSESPPSSLSPASPALSPLSASPAPPCFKRGRGEGRGCL